MQQIVVLWFGLAIFAVLEFAIGSIF